MPTYVKCVHMLGGLDDNEINSTYVKVIFINFALEVSEVYY